METRDEPLRLLTLQETAEVLHIPPRTLQRMIRRKKLLAFKVGNQWRVRESHLTELMQGLEEL